MPTIIVHTYIQAPPALCFDLSRSMDLHKASAAHTGEEIIAGRRSGLIELGESVGFRATHLGIRQKLSSHITHFDFPHHFRDEQLKGIFAYFRHDHLFEAEAEGTKMTDRFEYAAPLGVLGRLASWLFLNSYLKRFLEQRNALIKQYAESAKWQELEGMQANY